MKKILFILFIFSFVLSFSKDQYIKIPQLGSDAPAFKAKSTMGDVNFPKDFEGRWVILFSMPSASTPLCTSELKSILFDNEYFKSKNCDVIGVSFSGLEEQKRWIDDIRLKWNVRQEIPLISDAKKTISRKYGMYQPNVSKEKSMRCVYFIDPQATVRAVLVYPLFNGRNVTEIKRLLGALQIVDRENVVTPANWTKGSPTYVCPQCRAD